VGRCRFEAFGCVEGLKISFEIGESRCKTLVDVISGLWCVDKMRILCGKIFSVGMDYLIALWSWEFGIMRLVHFMVAYI
jgi:hypothetical protein